MKEVIQFIGLALGVLVVTLTLNIVLIWWVLRPIALYVWGV